MTTITLPEKDEMLKRLVRVDAMPHLQEKFYPKLAKHAGTQKVAEGVALMMSLAIYDYCQGMPPQLAAVMEMRAPNFVDAIVDDEAVAAKAKEILAST